MAKHHESETLTNLLSEKELNQIKSTLGSKVDIQGVTLAQWMVGTTDSSDWTNETEGVVLLAKDWKKKGYYIKFLGKDLKRCLFEEEIYQEMQYNITPDLPFHTFDGKENVIGIYFVDEDEAHTFGSLILHRIEKRQKIQKLKNKKSQKGSKSSPQVKRKDSKMPSQTESNPKSFEIKTEYFDPYNEHISKPFCQDMHKDIDFKKENPEPTIKESKPSLANLLASKASELQSTNTQPTVPVTLSNPKDSSRSRSPSIGRQPMRQPDHHSNLPNLPMANNKPEPVQNEVEPPPRPPPRPVKPASQLKEVEEESNLKPQPPKKSPLLTQRLEKKPLLFPPNMEEQTRTYMNNALFKDGPGDTLLRPANPSANCLSSKEKMIFERPTKTKSVSSEAQSSNINTTKNPQETQWGNNLRKSTHPLPGNSFSKPVKSPPESEHASSSSPQLKPAILPNVSRPIPTTNTVPFQKNEPPKLKPTIPPNASRPVPTTNTSPFQKNDPPKLKPTIPPNVSRPVPTTNTAPFQKNDPPKLKPSIPPNVSRPVPTPNTTPFQRNGPASKNVSDTKTYPDIKVPSVFKNVPIPPAAPPNQSMSTPAPPPPLPSTQGSKTSAPPPPLLPAQASTTPLPTPPQPKHNQVASKPVKSSPAPKPAVLNPQSFLDDIKAGKGKSLLRTSIKPNTVKPKKNDGDLGSAMKSTLSSLKHAHGFYDMSDGEDDGCDNESDSWDDD